MAAKTILIEQLVENIGNKIRMLRTQDGLSLQQLAIRAGVSSTAIHKIERSEMTPSITVLMKIADALGRKVGYFIGEGGDLEEFEFLEGAEFSPCSDRNSLFNVGRSIEVESLAYKLRDGKLYATIFTIAPGTRSGDVPTSHHGEELCYCFEGSAEFEIQGKTYTVGPGDSIHFLARHPHCWRVQGDGTARLLWIMSPPPYVATEIW